MMRKYIYSFLWVLIFAFSPIHIYAYDAEVNGLYYNLNSDSKTAEVTCPVHDYTYVPTIYKGIINIPNFIIYQGIQYNVTSISGDTFAYCTDLTSITIPNSITSIGAYAFQFCSSLTSLSLPNSLATIKDGAFRGCSSLISIVIPQSVTSIGNYVFNGCHNLNSIFVEKGNPKYDSRDNCNAMIETSSNCLISGCKNTIIPNTVTEIGPGAFGDCLGLTILSIPNSVTSVGESAFEDCTRLVSLTIPQSVNSIGMRAFLGCTGLNIISVENGNLIYDSRDNCNAIIETSTHKLIFGCKNTIIPNSVSSIDSYAFFGYEDLSSITIPSNVKTIFPNAFFGCSNLISVHSEIRLPFAINSTVFEKISPDAVLYVPKGTKSSYQQFSGWTQHFKEIIEESGTEPTTYMLTIASAGKGNTTYNGTMFREQTKSFSVNEGSSATISFAPDNGYKIASVWVGNTNVTSNVYNNQYTISNITGDTNVVVYYEQMPSTDFVMTIKTNSLGKVGYFYTTNPNPGADHTEYNGTVTSEYSRSIVKGGAITLSFYPNEGCELTKLIINNTNVTPNVANGKYTINNIVSNLDITATFEESSDPKQRLDGYDYVDLGLPSGKLWATVNYGASQPEDYGNYVYWSSVDIIRSSWGESWMTPTLDDVKELINKCTWTWETRNGINGYTIRGSNGNTIFLPAAGVKADKVSGVGSSVYYWTSTKATGSEYYLANIIMASPSDVGWGSLNTNFAQIPIRPVSKEGKAITTYSLSISASGNGYASYNGTSTRNQTRTFTVNEGTSATISFAPDNGYRIAKVLVNNTNVTSSVYNNQYTISNISANTTVSVTFEQIPPTTYTLSISASGNGYASYNGTSTRNQTRTFTVNEGTSATISFAPDNGYKISSVKVNNADVTSQVTNSKYTISNITGNKTVSVVFVEEIKNMTYNGVNYRVTSSANRTVNVANGNYGYALTVPASFTYQSQQWQVTGIDADALSNELAAVIWNPSVVFPASISNPNFLLYVTSQQYAPSGIKNVIVNNTANSITLIDAASGNNFYCPRNFTAQYISYIHNYGMTTGINEARGWESIALPFDVKSITHSYKGSLVPFAKWSSQTDTKPFWLYELGSSGFVAVSEIKANKPYIISMPNNSQYDDRYNVDGVVTFTATNATVKSSDNLQNGVFGEKTFIPNFVNGPSRSNIYVLNVVNSYSTHSGAYASGSRFVKNLRAIHPFEAYITLSGNSAKESIPIFDDTTTWIQGIETMTYNHERGKVYNLNGQQIKLDENRRVGELQKGIYIINGKKIVIK